MLKHLPDIIPTQTSHGVGLKRVLLSSYDTCSSITQIAMTSLHSGVTIEVHVHASMEEFFFFVKGEACLNLDGKDIICREGDFVQVECGVAHILRAISDVEVMTIGVAV